MSLSIANLILILIVVLILFGAGKLPKVMGDLGRGIHNFRAGLKGEKREDEQKKLDEK